ncbi:MAG: hypothetical protein QXY55_05820 [Candidatus Korarchaeota archaeon]
MSQTITEEDVLDLAAKIAVQARRDGVERSQIENLLALVEKPSDPKISPWVVALYAYKQAGRKQAGRGKIGHKTADLIYEAMRKLCEAGCGKEDVRKLLGFMKWIYESLEGRTIPQEVDVEKLKLQDVLKMLRGS